MKQVKTAANRGVQHYQHWLYATFWQKMMKRYGNEEEYTKQLINQFKHGSEPEILIVVDKLLTGFDAPQKYSVVLVQDFKGAYFAAGYCTG